MEQKRKEIITMKNEMVLNVVGGALVLTGTLIRTYAKNEKAVKLLGKVINKAVEVKMK